MKASRFWTIRQKLFRPSRTLPVTVYHELARLPAPVSSCLDLSWYQHTRSIESDSVKFVYKRPFSSSGAAQERPRPRATSYTARPSPAQRWKEISDQLLNSSHHWEENAHNHRPALVQELCGLLAKDPTLAADPTRIQQVFVILHQQANHLASSNNQVAPLDARLIGQLFNAWRTWFMKDVAPSHAASTASTNAPASSTKHQNSTHQSTTPDEIQEWIQVFSQDPQQSDEIEVDLSDIASVTKSLVSFTKNGLLPPDGTPFHIILFVMARTGQVLKTDALIQWMEEEQANRRLVVASSCYLEQMTAHRLTGDAEQCDAILRRLVERSASISGNLPQEENKSDQKNVYGRVELQHFTVAMSAWIESSDTNLASKVEDIFQLMKKTLHARKMRPKAQTYCTLMKAHIKQESLRHRIQTEMQVRRSPSSMSPEAAKRCLEILKEMRKEGISPDIYCYSTCIDACTKSGSPRAMEEAEDLLEEMQQDYGLEPNEVMYTSIVSGYARSGMKDAAAHADAAFAKLKAQGIVPSLKFYNSLLDAHAKAADMSRVEDIVEEISVNGLRPDIYTYNTWMNGYAKSRQPERMEQIYQHVVQLFKKANDKATEPTRFTHTIRLQAWAKAGSPHMATKALQDQIRMGHTPEVGHFTAVLGSWLRSKLPESAEKAEAGLRQMIHLTKSGRFEVLPDLVAFSTVLGCHLSCNSPDLETKAMNLFRELKQLAADNPRNERFQINSMFYARLIEAQVQASNETSEENLWEIIQELNDQPDAFWNASARKAEQQIWSHVGRKFRKSVRFRDNHGLQQALRELEVKGLGKGSKSFMMK